ncbi:LOW QUALITY PROTEIN: ciliary rootlet coiled-coil, rootletin [Choristoneura fumiferana]|uniref:LOW QUALITY PROTEIN: ciliary rootlet coiled-coil, rootletin n=1 Tax=Choristoneura fumiferana TaxID=7141 RepID=UPI003D15DF51
MPLPARESLTTPRSARAPVARRTGTLPHQRLKREKSLESPPEMDSPGGSVGSDLRRQNEELRARLAGESADHRRRLDAYRRAQQGQAALVSRLQAKVLQYKQRCSELEQHMLETTPRSEPSYRAAPTTARSAVALPAPAALPSTSSTETRRDERIADLETALRRLDEEKRKCEKLVTQNNLLRDQLEESHQLNEALTNDLQKLTNDWEALRDEMNVKEDEWKDEEQAFNDYYTSEHNRLLSLWREVVSVKRFFTELQTSTERDLFKVKNDFESATRELVGTLSGYAINAYAQGPRALQQNLSQPQGDHHAVTSSPPNITVETLRIDLRDVTSQRDTAQAELRERDARIQRLLGELQGLEERYEVAEAMCSEANVMRSALEEVARALIQDSETDVPTAQHLHMSERSPRRGVPQSANATAFAESTISAVQAALHKYQIQIHELQVKLQNTREQLSTSRKHCDAADATILSLENKVQDLQAKLDQANADLNQLSQDKESMQKSVETLRIDKNNLERNRVEINAMVESLTSDYEKLQKINSRLEKTIEALETDKRTLNAEVDHLHREASNRESILRAEEERSARTRSELVTVREELNKTCLARDLLDQQKMEADSIMSQMEKHRNDLEIELERTLLERGDLQDLVDKLQAAIRNLETDRKKLQDEVKHLEDEKSSLSSQSSEQLGDLNSLRKELLSAEQTRMELEADKASLQEKIKFVEADREKVEMELRQVVRERGELSSQLTAMVRKKDTLNEEIMRLQQRLEQANETIGRINRALEDHVKDGEEKQILIDSLDKDKQHLQEQLASVRAEKDALEAVLFDTANLLDDAEARRAKLDRDLQDAMVQQENHKVEKDALEAALFDTANLLDDAEARRAKLDRDLQDAMVQQENHKGRIHTGVSDKYKQRLQEQLRRTRWKQRCDTANLLDDAEARRAKLDRDLQDAMVQQENHKGRIHTGFSDKYKQYLQEQLRRTRWKQRCDTANLLDDAEARRAKLDRDLQDAMVQQENHKGQIARLTKELESSERKLRETRNSMQQQSGKKEAEYQSIITNINRTSAENITKLKEEKEQLRQSLEHKLSQTITALTSEKESSEAGAREREKKLLVQRDQLILQHDEAMLRAESDKQQALIMAHQEQQALIERLEEAKRVLDCSQNKLERVKRDAAARSDQDRGHINQLKDELAALKTRLEEAKAAAEDDCARFENRIKELHLEKEASNRECQDVRAQLSLAEDKYDTAYTQLQDTIRKLKELENESESLRKELTDVRRQLSNCVAERDKYNSSCRELRDHVKRAEHERREAARARDEAVHTVASEYCPQYTQSADEYNSSCRELRDHVKRAEHERREAARARDEAVHTVASEYCPQYTQSADEYNSSCRELRDHVKRAEHERREAARARDEAVHTVASEYCPQYTQSADEYNSSCRELRDHVKRAEHERREAARARDEAVHTVATLEENRSSLEIELSRLQNMLKESETGGEHVTRELRATEAQLKRERAALEQANHDIKELQSRLQNESEERERTANEAAAARRHGAEMEALLGAARADLAASRQRGAELEEACRARDQELVLRLEDCRSKERRLEELKHNLEVCLADATQQIQELKARLGGSEGRCRALEASLTQCESGKREAEAKLSSIAHTLRRVCGVQPDGSVHAARAAASPARRAATHGAARRRLASPARRYSPHRGRDHSEDRNEIIDVDPELVKKGVRHLMHEVCQIERERDDYKSQMNVLKKQLKDASEQQGKGDTKLQSITTNLRSLQEEKGRMQNVIGQKDAQINGLNESVQSKTVEISNLRDRITSLEATLSSITEEKVQNENKGESLRVQLAERVQEVGQLREALAAAEGRAARLDVRRAQLEGDVQRAAVAARDREQALKKLQERCEGYCRTIASLEDRCTSLKGTVEQLSTSLQKAATAESDLRAELSKTQRMLNEAKNNEQNAFDKLRQLQKNCANCENERRVLSEKLESAKSALVELKRLNCTLEDQVHRLTNQLANVEVQRSGLESQLRMTTWDGKESADSELERELHALQRERSELKAKNDALQESMRKMEADRRLNRTTALRSKSHDRTEKSVYYSDLDSGPDSTKDSMRYLPTKDSNLSAGKDKSFTAELSLLELENRELRMKIRRMEKELTDKEAELKLARSRYLSDLSSVSPSRREDVERYRQAALQAERLLEAREASHRQQIIRLENQAAQLRSQLSAEIRRRQSYVARSGRAARDVQRLRSALGRVSQDPALDSYTLEHEARKLDSTLAHSLPPLNDSYDSSK